MMFLGMAPFGALLAGVLAHPLGAPMTVAVGGTACMVAAALFGSRLPGVRRSAREVAQVQRAADL